MITHANMFSPETHHPSDVWVGRHVQGAVPKAVLGCDASPLLQQSADNSNMPRATSEVQWSILVFASGVDARSVV